jgi:phosphoglycolate phosphatase
MDALFFDLDGTLTDPLVGIARSIVFALERLGLPVPDDAEMRALVGPPIQVSMRARFGDEALVEEIVRLFRVRFGDVGMYENAVYPGVPEMLAQLAPVAPLYVCTSKPHVYANPILRRFGLAGAFAGVYGSELDGTRADKRELLAYALARQGIAPGARVALLGDRDLDVRAARANGTAAWGAAWGYGAPGELDGADHVFAAPQDVPLLIAR